MHRKSHEVVARCAAETVITATGRELPVERIAQRIMEPDEQNYERILHRAEGSGWRAFVQSVRRARRWVEHPEFRDVVGSIVEAIHLATDFCTMPHAPQIIKDSVAESSYEEAIDTLAKRRRVEPSSRAMAWYDGLNVVRLEAFMREAHGSHWHRTGTDITSTPADDLEQAIYVASCVLLAICGEKPTDWEDTRDSTQKWADRVAAGIVALIPVIGPAAVASYYLTPPEER